MLENKKSQAIGPIGEYWHVLSVEQCFQRLKGSKKGLSQLEAKKRQKKFGSNELSSENPLSGLAILINQIKSPLVYVLFLAGIISVFLGHPTDASVIFFAVLINTIFGYFQESKANRAILSLKKAVKQEAKVLRDGREIKIDSRFLVPGDVVVLRPGDKIPADARLIDGEDLELVEAALTGESRPSKKNFKALKKETALADRENMVFMGSLITRGHGLALICAIGHQTEIGQIAGLIRKAKIEPTPLQLKLAGFSRLITLAVAMLCLLVFTLGFLAGKDLVEMFIITVALAVSAIPEGLLVAVTVVLAIGMQKILRQKALVRKLVATETLGSVSVICMDKTGTLTQGRMRVAKIITADREYSSSGKMEISKIEKEQDLILKTSILCSSAVIENPDAGLEDLRIIGDFTEEALLIAALESGFDKTELDKTYPRLSEIPFDSEKKFMATLNHHQKEKHYHVFAKGAPEKILDFCDQVMIVGEKQKLTADKIKFLKTKYQSLSRQGLRILAVAYKTGDKFQKLENELDHLVFLGFIAISDPLRPEAKEALLECYRAGIRPIIITGDHPLTAKAIFNDLGFPVGGNLVEGRELDKWSDQELRKKIKNIDIYARVEPRHKMRVIDAWQSRGEVVAMVGDGINDAPAMKSADIGVALGSGSDVAKETADMILLDNNFQVIVSAVEQGRIIFDNIRKIILYLLASGFSEIVLVAGGLLFGLPMPVLAVQILWINLVADSLPALSLALEPGEKQIMRDWPRKKEEPILNNEMKIMIFGIGLASNLILFSLFIFLAGAVDDIAYVRTLIFVALGVGSILYIFSIRNFRSLIFRQNPFANRFLNLAVLFSFLALAAVVYVPFLQNIFQTVSLGWREWVLAFALSGIQIVLIEMVKYLFITKGAKLRREYSPA